MYTTVDFIVLFSGTLIYDCSSKLNVYFIVKFYFEDNIISRFDKTNLFGVLSYFCNG